MSWLRRLPIDRFLLAILAAAVLASIAPATGAAIPVVDGAAKLAIALLFFLYGARLHPRQALAGLAHWRLHLTILGFTFVVFPLVGLLLEMGVPTPISPALYPGLLYLTLVPSTVQSSIAFTSIARGNVAGAIVSASTSNLLGVVITPALAWALMSTTGQVEIGPSAVADIIAQLLVPFAAGQLSRRWTADFVARNTWLRLVDRGSIVLVVFAAFSAGMREGMWSLVSAQDLAILIAVCVALLGAMLSLTWVSARRFGFGREDAIAIQFCGTKKSLASGLPMATVLFAGQPLGLLMLPLMVFHQAQLMACSALAARYAKDPVSPDP